MDEVQALIVGEHEVWLAPVTATQVARLIDVAGDLMVIGPTIAEMMLPAWHAYVGPPGSSRPFNQRATMVARAAGWFGPGRGIFGPAAFLGGTGGDDVADVPMDLVVCGAHLGLWYPSGGWIDHVTVVGGGDAPSSGGAPAVPLRKGVWCDDWA